MYEVLQAFHRLHPELGLSQKALTGRLRNLSRVGGYGYPIQTKQNVATLIGYTLRRDTDLNLSNSADTAA